MAGLKYTKWEVARELPFGRVIILKNRGSIGAKIMIIEVSNKIGHSKLRYFLGLYI